MIADHLATSQQKPLAAFMQAKSPTRKDELRLKRRMFKTSIAHAGLAYVQWLCWELKKIVLVVLLTIKSYLNHKLMKFGKRNSPVYFNVSTTNLFQI